MNDDMSNILKNFSQMLNNQDMPDNIKNILNSLNTNNNSNTNDNTQEINNTTSNNGNNTNSTFDNMNNSNNYTNDNNFSNEGNNNFNQNNQDSTNNPFGNIDFNTILKFQKIFNSINNNQNDSRTNLLLSLKPYLKDSRKNKVDQYIQLMKMEKVFEIINPLGGDNKNV